MSDIGAPLTLVGYEDDMDLRSISWNQELLEGEAAKYNLKHGQAVVYSNVTRDKVRLIAVFYGMAVLILPPIDPADKVSLYIKINKFLRRFKPGKEVVEHLEGEIKDAEERLLRSRVRREMACIAERKRRATT